MLMLPQQIITIFNVSLDRLTSTEYILQEPSHKPYDYAPTENDMRIREWMDTHSHTHRARRCVCIELKVLCLWSIWKPNV